MQYLCVECLHDSDDLPTAMYHELDDDRMEIRRVELFRDRRPQYASQDSRRGRAELSWLAIPPAEEIDADPEFSAKEISCEEFESVWTTATTPAPRGRTSRSRHAPVIPAPPVEAPVSLDRNGQICMPLTMETRPKSKSPRVKK